MDQQEGEWLGRARRDMVEHQLRHRHITDQRVLSAMDELPRERFIGDSMLYEAYDDRALPIDCGQTISQPYMVAVMTQCLEVAPAHRVLEIGTGSGYQTAVLAKLARHVYTVERIEHLSQQAQTHLHELNIGNVSFCVGDGTLGWADHAPYDRILVTAGAPDVGQALVDQLVDGGLLVVPVGAPDEQVLTVVQRQGDRTIEKPSIACRFVKLIGREGWD